MFPLVLDYVSPPFLHVDPPLWFRFFGVFLHIAPPLGSDGRPLIIYRVYKLMELEDRVRT